MQYAKRLKSASRRERHSNHTHCSCGCMWLQLQAAALYGRTTRLMYDCVGIGGCSAVHAVHTDLLPATPATARTAHHYCTVTPTRCHELQLTPRRFQIGAALSGCVL